MALDPKVLKVIETGLHNLYCTPYSAVPEGKDKGRFDWHRDLRPELGDGEAEYACRCKDLKIVYNGEVVRDGVSPSEVDWG